MMVMMHSTSANPNDLDLNLPRNHNHKMIMSEDQDQGSFIIKSTCPISWKLYQNPFFNPTNTTIISDYSKNEPLKLKAKQLQRKYSSTAKFLHHSDLKMSNNSNISLNSNLSYKTQVAELKAELEMERKLRKSMEILNKKLSRELVDQVQKERLCVCEDLTKEVSRLKEEMKKMKAEMDEERKMLRMAEVLREERVQMKLADAQLFYHQEFLNNFLLQQQQQSPAFLPSGVSESSFVLHSKKMVYNNNNGGKNENVVQKNPHIKQGIKGFVEFQKAIKAKNGCNISTTTSNSNKQLREVGGFSNKVECQKAQLRVLFKHKCSLPYSSHNDRLIIS